MSRKLKNNKLTCYLCRSKGTSITLFESIKNTLILSNINVLYYNELEAYDTSKIKLSDFMFVIPPDNEVLRETDRGKWELDVGRGQYSEMMLANRINIPTFIYHSSTNIASNNFRVSKLQEDEDWHYVNNVINSWKKKYGVVCSYVIGAKPICLLGFLDGFFERISNTHIVDLNRKLLLLINKSI